MAQRHDSFEDPEPQDAAEGPIFSSQRMPLNLLLQPCVPGEQREIDFDSPDADDCQRPIAAGATHVVEQSQGAPRFRLAYDPVHDAANTFDSRSNSK